MNRKRILSILLASVLTLPVPYTSVMAAEFTDGSASAQDAGLFSAGEGSEETPYDEYIDGVQYLYNEESDSYIVDSVYNVTGETVYLKSEIHGRKVTEIALWIYRDCFEDVGEPVYLGEIVLPDTLLKIDSGAFRDGQMTRLDIPDSVREIGSGAFNYCQNLRYLYFALSVFNFQPYRTGMAIPHIYFRDYGTAKIYCPSYVEQKHIADVLGKLENKLFLEQNILTSFNLQKRYLLGQMFI